MGVNNIPPKICTYSCVYCQLGRTIKLQSARQAFYKPEEILREVQDKIEKARAAGESVDYLTFVPDGESTLDIHLGAEIALLKPLGIKLAVITNSSLLWHEEVRVALAQADWVSLKMDAVLEKVWHRVDRPHGSLRLPAILEGALEFAQTFEGQLVTETMLVEGVNDGADAIGAVSDFLAHLKPQTAYLAIPTRPPAEAWVRSPDEEVINRDYQILRREVAHVEYLVGYEGNAFAFTGDVADDLLSITSVHPMREDAVHEFLGRAEADWAVVRDLIAGGQLVETTYEGRKFYVRKLNSRKG